MEAVQDKYRLLKALRPFSYSVAIGACSLGVIWALRQDVGSWWLGVVIVLTGVVLQAGVNLVNNQADTADSALGTELSVIDREAIRTHYKIGVGCFVFAGVVGVLLIATRGWPLAVMIVLGLLGAWFYSNEPIHYKRRGLGVPMVFLLMGVMLVVGSAMAMGATGFGLVGLALLSVPLSLMVALLLLANELRDREDDERDGLRTLTVRIGEEKARTLFWAMLGGSYVLTLVFWWPLGNLNVIWPIVLTLPLLVPVVRSMVSSHAESLQALPSQVGRLLMAFSLLFLLCYAGDVLFGGAGR